MTLIVGHVIFQPGDRMCLGIVLIVIGQQNLTSFVSTGWFKYTLYAFFSSSYAIN
jgi:hypothetical protein